MLTVAPGQSFLGDDIPLPDDAVAMIRRIGPVEAASPVDRAAGVGPPHRPRSPPGRPAGCRSQAVDPSLLETLGGTVADRPLPRRGARALSGRRARRVAAERLGIYDLDAPVQVLIAGRWFTVVGIIDPLPLAPELDRAALIGAEAAEAYLDADVSPTSVYVRADPAQVDEVRSVLGATANPERPEAVNVQRPSDAIEAQGRRGDRVHRAVPRARRGRARGRGAGHRERDAHRRPRAPLGDRPPPGAGGDPRRDRGPVLRRGAAARVARRRAGRHRRARDRRRLRDDPGVADRRVAARDRRRHRGDGGRGGDRRAVPGAPGRERPADGRAPGRPEPRRRAAAGLSPAAAPRRPPRPAPRSPVGSRAARTGSSRASSPVQRCASLLGLRGARRHHAAPAVPRRSPAGASSPARRAARRGSAPGRRRRAPASPRPPSPGTPTAGARPAPTPST